MTETATADPHRRTFLNRALAGAGIIALGPTLLQMSTVLKAQNLIGLGPLQAPDENGIRLPAGFSSRVVARAGRLVKRDRGLFSYARYLWHVFPDGGACFPTDDGGWIYVSNSEITGVGGAGALRFDSRGRIDHAYSILSGTNNNCAGGPTPWGTWLSCEEVPYGAVYECDVVGREPARRHRALGYFTHEAAAVDPVHNNVYLTEDESDGRLYRFTPENVDASGRMDLSAGLLEVAIVDDSGQVAWVPVPEPNPEPLKFFTQAQTRHQVAASTAFDGGEGIWYHDSIVYFVTKGNSRVWALDTRSQQLRVIYDAALAPDPILRGVDNVTVSNGGDVLVAEDGGDMQVVVIGADGAIAPLLQVVGQDHSEITGPAFNPDGTRFYFSSQRGRKDEAFKNLGYTYEISGPFV